MQQNMHLLFQYARTRRVTIHYKKQKKLPRSLSTDHMRYQSTEYKIYKTPELLAKQSEVAQKFEF